MCGAVSYTADVATEASACHCDMCRRWSGGPLLMVEAKAIEWADEAPLTVLATSDWAERGFCNRCGSSLLYRFTAEGKYQGMTTLAVGTLDDQSGLQLTKEWFIDRKPGVYALAGDRKRYTEADIKGS